MLPGVIGPRPRGSRRLLAPLALAALACAAGCGKKGPPLPPLATVPAAPTDVSVRRSGDEVTIRFTVPRANVSGVSPANLARVDVYGWTGEAGTPQDVFKQAPVVASVPVRRPPPPAPEVKPGEPPPPPPPPPTGPGVDQGTVAEVVETLTPAALEPLDIKKKKEKEKKVKEPALAGPLVLLPPATALTRNYLVVGVNRGDDRGPAAPRLTVPLWPAPPPPTGVTAQVSEKAVTISWTPPSGLRRPVVFTTVAPPPAATPGAAPGAPAQPGPTPATEPDEDEEAPSRAAPVSTPQPSGVPAAPQAPAPPVPQPSTPPAQPSASSTTPSSVAPVAPPPSGSAAETAPQEGAPGAPAPDAGARSVIPVRLLTPWPAVSEAFVVYEVAAPDAKAAGVPPPPAAQPFPALLTPAPIPAAQTTFADPRVEFGVARCYVVRTRETVGTAVLESASSDPVCVTPVDTFPPAAPKQLGAVASEGAISLIWEANTEPDLAGYIVLRGVAPGDRLQPITPQPIKETTFRDATVKRGTQYVYAVIAVDTAKPANRSEPSNRVEETAR